MNRPNKKYDFMTWVDPTLEDLQLRLEFQSGGFQKWGNPKMLGLFPGKSHLKMDDVSRGSPISGNHNLIYSTS